MKKFIPSIFSCIFIISSMFFLHGFSATTNIIQDTCKTASTGDPNINYNFCTSSLQSAPSSRSASLQGLGEIAIKLVSNNVTGTRSYVKNLLKNTAKIDKFTKECLNDCYELYSDAITTLNQASVYYDSSKFYEANIKISSVMDAATTCEDGFHEKKGIVSPLTKRNNFTFELSAVSLSIMNLLQEKVN